MRRMILGLLFLTALSGCDGGLPALVKELAKDPATACVTVTSVYGVARVYRTNPKEAMTVSCSPDGMNVTNPAPVSPATDFRGAAFSLPVTIEPTQMKLVPVEK